MSMNLVSLKKAELQQIYDVMTMNLINLHNAIHPKEAGHLTSQAVETVASRIVMTRKIMDKMSIALMSTKHVKGVNK